jgi:hypothetical protein
MTSWNDRLRRRLGRHAQKLRSPEKGFDGGVDLPPPPPACPAGWRIGPPHFIGVGVQRCGSTRWGNLVMAHPEIVRTLGNKELHYFDRFYAGGCSSAEISRYHAYFPSDGRKAGEWTPYYVSAPWIPPLLAAAAPQARLLVVIRDPVERYLSGIALNAKVAQRREVPLSRYAPLEAFSRGFYHSQLENLLAHFDRSQVLVLQYERCNLEPEAQLRRTYEFLELSDLEFMPDLEAHPREQRDKPVLDDATRAAFVQAYSDDVRALASSFPEIDLSVWPNFTHLTEHIA